MKANIVDIKRFAVHDGYGIRTTVFFKGCSLKCKWCHNPETISPMRQIAFYSHKCSFCGACADVCEDHILSDGIHNVLREKCIFCGKCTDACPNEALKIYGREIDTEEIAQILLEDKDFYDESGGGITLSGGECLLQSEACADLLKIMKEKGINTAVDTCGNVPREAFERVIPFTDVFLYDIKAASADVHRKCTGHTNERILENLYYLDDLGCKLEIRIPLVIGENDGEMTEIAGILGKLKNVIRTRVLPYHNYAAPKYAALGMENTMPERLPTDEEIKTAEFVVHGG